MMSWCETKTKIIKVNLILLVWEMSIDFLNSKNNNNISTFNIQLTKYTYIHTYMYIDVLNPEHLILQIYKRKQDIHYF